MPPHTYIMSLPTAASYKYNPIDLASDAIRLVYLARGYFTEPIECRLFETWLHHLEGVPYEALSYHWGGSNKDAEITLDGCKSKITNNLFSALLYLRLEDRDRILWIDAICINQDDKKERGHQVGQMRSVYKNADQVIVWLGLPTRDVELLIAKMNEMSADLDLFHLETTLDIWQKSWHDSNLSDRYRRALEDLLQRPWFRRVWIIQEAANARTATIVCGRRSVSTKTFVRVTSMLKITPRKSVQAVLDVLPGYLRKVSWWSGDRDLYTLIVKFAGSEATDPRDKIYALLGISSDACDKQTFPPNYEKPFSDVLRDMARFLIFGALSSGQEYPVPAMTWTGLIEDLGRVRRDCVQWVMQNFGVIQDLGRLTLEVAQAIGNTESSRLLRLIHGIKHRLRPKDISILLLGLVKQNYSPAQAASVRALLQAPKCPDFNHPLEMSIQAEQWQLIEVFLTERQELLEEKEMNRLLCLAIGLQKTVSLNYLLSRFHFTASSVIFEEASKSGDTRIIRTVFDHFYDKVQTKATLDLDE